MKFLIFVKFSIFYFLISMYGANSKSIDPNKKKLEEKEIKNDEDRLILVHALWRHGERAPFYLFPKRSRYDASSDKKNWPNGLGVLTENGLIQHYQLGRKLRQRYVKEIPFLSSKYDPKEVHIKSTKTPRTITSAKANMVGMFGRSKKHLIKEDPIFDQVEIDVLSPKNDHTLYTTTPCHRKDELWKYVKKTPEFLKFLEDYKDLFENLTHYAGEKVTYRHLLYEMADFLKIQLDHGYNLTSDERAFVDRVFEANKLVCKYENGLGLTSHEGIHFNFEIPKISAGTILWTIIQQMEDKYQCSINETALENCEEILKRKYYALSGHDNSISCLFATFGFEDMDFDRDELPMLSSCVLIELWLKADNTNYIKVYYTRPNSDFIELTPKIKGCTNTTDLETFSKRSEPYRPKPNIEKLCKTSLFAKT